MPAARRLWKSGAIRIRTYTPRARAVEGIYKTSADLADALDKGVDDFRNKKVFDFGFSDPSKVELKGATYTKSGDKWMSGGKTMDNTSVQTLIDKLRDLAATKFAEKGGGQPVFDGHGDLQRRQAGRKSGHYQAGRPNISRNVKASPASMNWTARRSRICKRPPRT